LWANLHLLFWLSLFPFTTAWMGTNAFPRVPTAVYGFVALMAAVAYFVLQLAIVREEGPTSSIATALGRDVKGKASVVVYLSCIPLAMVNRWIAVAGYVAIAALWLVPDRRLRST
jgi:uncharacterized membrane protein